MGANQDTRLSYNIDQSFWKDYHVFETLKNIDMIGNDLRVRGSGAGGCGKGGQFQLPVTLGGPHIRVQNLTVGGKAA